MFFDYKNIEIRTIGYYAAVALGDTAIADQIKAGLDPHTESAKVLFETDTPTDDQRQKAKVRNFSLFYGGGSRTLVKQGIAKDFNQGRFYVAKFHEAFPCVDRLQRMMAKRIQERGYVTTMWGRHLHVQEEHKLVNAVSQGTAAEMMRDAMRKTHRWLAEHPEYEAHMVNTVHDEIQLDVPQSEIATMSVVIPQLMDHAPISEVIPIAADCEISYTSWADKAPYEEEALAA